MALPIRFEKQVAEHYLACIKSGRAVDPPSGLWTKNEMLMLAGALHFAVTSQGPVMMPGVDLNTLPKERREAIWEQLEKEIHETISFYSHLAMLVEDGEYDEQYKSKLLRGTLEDDNGKGQITLFSDDDSTPTGEEN